MSFNETLIEYYTNLLIIQYHSKPRARATIAALLSILLIYDLIIAVREAYNIDTAIGKQLDVLGKYAGVDRFFYKWHFEDRRNFSMLSRQDTLTPTSYQAGFSLYSDYNTKEGHFLKRDDLYLETIQLNDTEYRKLIKLKIAHNYTNSSYKSIFDNIYDIFGLDLIPSTNDRMDITYFINDLNDNTIKAAIQKDILLRPATVGNHYIKRNNKKFFAFCERNKAFSSNITGFSTYEDFNTKEGRFFKRNDLYNLNSLIP